MLQAAKTMISFQRNKNVSHIKWPCRYRIGLAGSKRMRVKPYSGQNTSYFCSHIHIRQEKQKRPGWNNRGRSVTTYITSNGKQFQKKQVTGKPQHDSKSCEQNNRVTQPRCCVLAVGLHRKMMATGTRSKNVTKTFKSDV